MENIKYESLMKDVPIVCRNVKFDLYHDREQFTIDDLSDVTHTVGK